MSDSAGRTPSPDRCALGHEDCGWTVLHNAMVEDAEASGRGECLNVCIVSDDDGRGYWCEDCPNLTAPARRTDV